VGACGICCDICGLNKKFGCVCSSGTEKIAKGKVNTRWGGKGVLCLVLDCAVKHGVAYCMRDCAEFPCKKYFEWYFPYGKDYLKMHQQRSKHEKEKKQNSLSANINLKFNL
jgi:hypothetical protein